MKAICAVLPHVYFIICRFHAIQAVHRWVNKLHLKPEQQKYWQILEIHFSEMVYSPDELGYMEAYKSICEISEKATELAMIKVRSMH